MSVDVIVPWRPDGQTERELAWLWVLGRYEAQHPSYGVLTGSTPSDGPWVKARAVIAAATLSTADIVVVADADVWCDGVEEAVQAVENGAEWATPHHGVRRLNRAATERVLRGGELDTRLRLDRRPYVGILGGGITVLRRETLFDIPLDPRFTGWGQEDESWGLALYALLGKPFRAKPWLYHLWHPPATRLTPARGSPAGWKLRCRYHAARRDQAAMRALLKEAHESFHAA